MRKSRHSDPSDICLPVKALGLGISICSKHVENSFSKPWQLILPKLKISSILLALRTKHTSFSHSNQKAGHNALACCREQSTLWFTASAPTPMWPTLLQVRRIDIADCTLAGEKSANQGLTTRKSVLLPAI